MNIQEKEPRSGWEAFAWQVLRQGFPTKFMGKLAIIYAAIIIIYGITSIENFYKEFSTYRPPIKLD